MKLLDRGLSLLLVLGAIGHTLGVMDFYHDQPHPLFWSLSATLVILFVAAINLLRITRPGDRGVAAFAVGATASYFVTIIGFGRLVGNMADPRVIGFGAVCLGLIAFGIGALRRA